MTIIPASVDFWMSSRWHWYMIWRLERQHVRAHRAYFAQLIKKLNDSDAVPDEHLVERLQFLNDCKATLEEVHSHSLLRVANRLRIPIPDADTDPMSWRTIGRHGEEYAQRALTIEAEARLREAIRTEKAGRRSSAAFWVGIVATIVGALTGLVGTIIGLVAVSKSAP